MVIEKVLALVLAGSMMAVRLALGQATQPSTLPAYSPQTIQTSAMRMLIRFNQSQLSRGQEAARSIPETFWTDEIRSLKPIRIYSHRANIVVVQQEADGAESGQYISLHISSYAVTNGVDGFNYTPDPRARQVPSAYPIYAYKRTSP